MFCINVSGGRTSGYMLWLMKSVLEEIGADFRAVFCNTGFEHPETIKFIAAMEDHWQVPITRLEYKLYYKSPGYKVVQRGEEDTGGRPFTELCRYYKKLPARNMRFCTKELKVRTAARYMKQNFGLDYVSFLGIRADEPHRNTELLYDAREKHYAAYPLADLGVTKEDVLEFWREQSFDLGLRISPTQTVGGNCVFCFLKGEHNTAETIAEFPELLSPWKALEEEFKETFSPRFSLAQVEADLKSGRKFKLQNGYYCAKSFGDCTG